MAKKRIPTTDKGKGKIVKGESSENLTQPMSLTLQEILLFETRDEPARLITSEGHEGEALVKYIKVTQQLYIYHPVKVINRGPTTTSGKLLITGPFPIRQITEDPFDLVAPNQWIAKNCYLSRYSYVVSDREEIVVEDSEFIAETFYMYPSPLPLAR